MVASGSMTLVKGRGFLREDIVRFANKSVSMGSLYGAVSCFMFLVLLMLYLEAGAQGSGWQDFQWLFSSVYLGWMYFRKAYIAPFLQKIADFCILLFLIQSVDRIVRCMGWMYMKWWNIKPVPRNPSLESDDINQPDMGHPMVLVQVPMYNEREV